MHEPHLQLARLLHDERLAEAETRRRVRAALDRQRAGRLEAR